MAAPKQSAGFNPQRPQNRGNGKFNNNRRSDAHRLNERIRCPEVRCFGPHGEKLGVIPTAEALDLASKLGVDLIEIAPNANPPVCVIQEYGKFLYEEKKKQKQNKQVSVKLKEIKLRPGIGDNDLYVKAKRAEMFLFNGDKVKVTLQFRFRELEHAERGHEIVARLVEKLAHVASLDAQPKLMGRAITAMLSPLPQNKRKLIYNAEPIDSEELEDDSAEDDGEE
ncbi:MAG: translation initiation factor IF-3 [Opitutales bacterium]|nr:translation initiation factor IF-3 [Opitutales bacterium]